MADCCFIVKPHLVVIQILVCCMISQAEMTWLWLGIIAKAMILVSHLHPKDVITKAYPNYSKSDKVEGLVVVSKRSVMKRRLLWSFVISQKTNKQKNWIVGLFIGLSTS